MDRLRRLEKLIEQLQAARRLESASIRAGGLRVRDVIDGGPYGLDREA